MTKKELVNWIYRKLGYPQVRVELHPTQIESCIDEARDELIYWATGNATEEIFFTVALSASIDEYELPSGVTTVVNVKEFDTSAHGINTLFSTQNYLYNQGVLSFLDNIGNYSMVDYHMALEFIDLLDRYMPNYYSWRHDRLNNKLKIRPVPDFDVSVGYLIIDSYMLAGTDETTTEITDDVYNLVWDNSWVKRYSLANAKEILGLIRRKFSNFDSIGNTGISLDGDSLISEAKEEKDMLKEELKDGSYSHTGYGILIG